jgi:hypothetical protein
MYNFVIQYDMMPPRKDFANFYGLSFCCKQDILT